MNETLQLINDRVSLRRYADRSIDPEEIDSIVRSAMRAPTAGNMMLYTILQVDDPEKKRQLAETCGHSFIADAPLVLVFLADMQRWVDFFETNDVPAHCSETETEYRMPDVSKLLMSCCDALIAAQNGKQLGLVFRQFDWKEEERLSRHGEELGRVLGAVGIEDGSLVPS